MSDLVATLFLSACTSLLDDRFIPARLARISARDSFPPLLLFSLAHKSIPVPVDDLFIHACMHAAVTVSNKKWVRRTCLSSNRLQLLNEFLVVSQSVSQGA